MPKYQKYFTRTVNGMIDCQMWRKTKKKIKKREKQIKNIHYTSYKHKNFQDPETLIENFQKKKLMEEIFKRTMLSKLLAVYESVKLKLQKIRRKLMNVKGLRPCSITQFDI